MDVQVSVLYPNGQTRHIPFHLVACALCRHHDSFGSVMSGEGHYCYEKPDEPRADQDFTYVRNRAPDVRFVDKFRPPAWCPYTGTDAIERVRMCNEFSDRLRAVSTNRS